MSQLRNQGSPSGKPRKSSKKIRGKHRRHRHHGQINFNSDASASGDIKHFTSTSATGIHQQKPTHQSSRDSTNSGKDFEFLSALSFWSLSLFTGANFRIDQFEIVKLIFAFRMEGFSSSSGELFFKLLKNHFWVSQKTFKDLKSFQKLRLKN